MDFLPNIKYRDNILIMQESFENIHRIIVWNTKDLNVGGNGSRDINFAILGL